MKTTDFLSQAEQLANSLTHEVNRGGADLQHVEECILDFVYCVGHEMFQSVSDGLADPVYENHGLVEGKNAYYKGEQRLRFEDRFGRMTTIQRCRYAIEGESGGWYPLDENLGMNKCYGYSPLMSYLLSFYGGHMPYADAAEKLQQALGFTISATAVERNTEKTGERIAHHPLQINPASKQSQRCQRMIVEVAMETTNGWIS